MTTTSQQSTSSADANVNNVFSAFGASLGYLGAEVSSGVSFEELLWPQRSFCCLSISAIPQLALLHPIDGPLRKVALEALDVIVKNGLLKRNEQGHMLGTPIVPERGWTYVMHDVKASASKAKALRNCLWTGVFAGLCPPTIVTTRNGMNTEGERLRIESVPRS
jgi:hypothetical protein